MYLLYCDDAGIVVAYHDDAVVYTPPEVYPTVKRIIPYDLPISTLQKVGPAPVGAKPSEMVDTRPYGQPVETPEILKMFAAQCRFVTVLKGFDFTAASGVIPVWTDRESYMLCGGLSSYAAGLAPDAPIEYTQGSLHYPITAAEAIALFTQFSELIQQCRVAEAFCLDDLNSATPTITTYQQVEAGFNMGVTMKPAKTRRPLMRMPK